MTDGATGWLPLTTRTFRQRLGDSVIFLAPSLFVALFLFQFGDLVFRDFTLWVRIVLSIASVIALAVVIIVVRTAINPIPTADFGLERLRISGRSIGFTEIVVATIVVAQPSARHRSIAIRFGSENGLSVLITLRTDETCILGDEERARLIAVLEASDIRMPHSAHDPTGKFARYNFPENLDRDAAVELVRSPPAPGDPLPVVENGRYPPRDG